MIKTGFRSAARRSGRYLKRVAKTLFADHLYVARSGPAEGFLVSGDLGFLHDRATYRDRFLMSLDLAGKTVYNVGGHIGVRTLYFSKAVGAAGLVVTFEPSPESFPILRRCVEMNSLTNVRLVNMGLSERPGTVLLVYGRGDTGLGSMNAVKQVRLINNSQGIKIRAALVEVCSLDDYIRANALPDPDFVKIDVEAHEYNVLLGMRETLERCKPSMEIELHRGTMAQRISDDLGNIVRFLAPLGYEIRDVQSGRKINEGDPELVRGVRHLYCTAKGKADLFTRATDLDAGAQGSP
jgi:FkbM family methyltransferase